MRNLSWVLVAVLILLTGLLLLPSLKESYSVHSQEQKSSEPEFESNVILIKLKEEPAKSLRAKLSEKEDAKLDFSKAELRDTGINSLTSIAAEDDFKDLEPLFGGIKDDIKNKRELNKEKTELSRWFKVTLNKENKQVKRDSNEYKDLEKLVEKLRKLEEVENVEVNAILSAGLTPNDTYYSSQWSPAKIEADSAWDITTGSSSVIVAILDTGILTNHADLSGKIVNSHNFSSSSTSSDIYGHGTHVAGTVAAYINNSAGVAGIAPGVSLLNAKVLGDNGKGETDHIASGIEWARNQGAHVINMSLGGNFDCDNEALIDAIDYAYSGNIVVVAAAGNDGVNDVHMPANCNHVISVGATESNDTKASFSNYGTAVDITAPGVMIYSTYYNGSYTWLSGTSMATPHVSAAAALIKSLNTSLTADQITSSILSGADAISGTGTYWSNGRLNVLKSLSRPVLTTYCNGSNHSRVHIEWPAMPGAIGYNIHRSTVSPASALNLGGTTGTAWNDDYALAGATHVYSIQTLYSGGASSYGPTVSVQAVSCSADRPTINPSTTTTYCVGSNARVHVEWSAVPGATGYNLYRVASGVTTHVGSTTGLAFNDDTIGDNVTALYSVQAVYPNSTWIYGYQVSKTSANCP